MEEEPHSVQTNGQEGGGGGGGGGGDEFYEEIEAPKFVDFTTPDHFCPDDRYWFCMRVGCDQKHEEELDSEAIYKNFVLRVMAARSPNVKLRKALSRKSPSLKCPLTAPAKSSKPRVSRLALISSISRKIVDLKDKAKQPPLHTKISATTPNVKAKQPSSVTKALTTPRNRKPISNPDTFRSVRNLKPKDVVVPKNRVVAKALVFYSPKKAVKTKVLLENGSNVGKLCSAMKKLDITSAKKHVSGYTKPLPLDTPRKQCRGREVKSRVFDSLHSNKDKGKEAKSLKRKKMEKDLIQCCDNDSSDMEIDEKLKKGSLEGSSKSVTLKSDRVNGDEERVEAGKTSESSSDEIHENQVEVVSETSKAEISSLSSSEENDSEENCDKEKTSDRNGHEDKPKLGSGTGKTLVHTEEDDKENAGASDNTEHDNEIMHMDDKENCITSEVDREQKLNDHSKRKNLGNHSASKNSQKVSQVAEKIPKEISTSAPTCAQGVKYSKPKPTNPKPFRFRTDERGMLKEANLEKKVHAPLKEITLDTLPEKSTKNHQNVIQANKTCLGQIEYESDSQSCEKRRIRLDQNGKVGATCLKTSKGDIERKLSEMTPPNRSTVLTKQKPQKERTKSPMVQPSFSRPRGVVSSKKKSVVSSKAPCQLSVINESVSTDIRPKKAAKPCGVSSAPKVRTPSRSSSRGRRPATIPKEPHFHTMHVPKSCTRLQKDKDLTDAQQN